MRLLINRKGVYKYQRNFLLIRYEGSGNGQENIKNHKIRLQNALKYNFIVTIINIDSKKEAPFLAWKIGFFRVNIVQSHFV